MMLDLIQPQLPAITLAVLLFAASAAFLVRFERARAIALVAAGVQVVLVSWITWIVVGQDRVWVYTIGGWGAPLGIDLTIDGVSAVMMLLTAVVGCVVTVYSAGYFPPKDSYRLFWSLWLFLWAALFALFASNDIFNLYVCLELLTISAVGLVAISGERAALFAGMRYILSALAGSLIYLFGVALVYASTGVLDFDLLAAQVSIDPTTQAGLALMVIGLLLKTALFPMHFWLPPAHANAVAPVSAVLSALVVKGSFYIIFKLMHVFTGHEMIPGLAELMGILGVCAIIWGSVQAFTQKRLKMMVAYSTVAQIGYLFLLFPLVAAADDIQTAVLAASAGLFHAVSHGLAKGAMFLTAGTIVKAVGSDRLEDMAGLSRLAPMPAFTFAIAGVSMVGLPPSGGFVSKWLYVSSAIETGAWWWAGAVVFGGLLAALYIFKVIALFMGSGKEPLQVGVSNRVITIAPLVLAVMSLVIGVFGQPILDLLYPAVESLTAGMMR